MLPMPGRLYGCSRYDADEKALKRRPYGEARTRWRYSSFDDGALGREVRLVDLEVHHPLGLGPEQRLEVVRRHDLVVLGDVVAGRRVVGAADVLGQPIELLVAQVGRALEHHVLEEVGEARAAGRIVAAADVIPDLHAHRRARAVLDRDHLQAVGETPLAVDDRSDLQDRRCVRRSRCFRPCRLRRRSRGAVRRRQCKCDQAQRGTDSGREKVELHAVDDTRASHKQSTNDSLARRFALPRMRRHGAAVVAQQGRRDSIVLQPRGRRRDAR